jgi:branched-chain amino acid transport system substrate-binding protein
VRRFNTKKAAVPAALLAGLLAAACSSGTAASAQGSASGGSLSTIVIGNIGAYSGTEYAAANEQTVHSLQAWAAWTNGHGGLNGHPVKIVSFDDQNNPATSLRDVEQMVQQDHVTAIAAPVASGTDDAWAAYVKAEKVPVIGGAAIDANWLTNPYMLAVGGNLTVYLESQLGAAKTVGTKVGEFACAELASCRAGVPTFASLAKIAGLGWAGAQFISESATDYIAPCTAMRNSGANVVIPELAADSIVRVIAACNQQNYKPSVILPASNIDSAILDSPAFSGAVGVSSSPLWFGQPDATTKDWDQTYTKMFPKDVPTGYATLGWQAGAVIATALEHAPATVTPQTLMQGLYAQPANSTFGGWTAPVTFAAGKASQMKSCMWYVQIKDGQLTAPKGTAAVCA